MFFQTSPVTTAFVRHYCRRERVLYKQKLMTPLSGNIWDVVLKSIYVYDKKG